MGTLLTSFYCPLPAPIRVPQSWSTRQLLVLVFCLLKKLCHTLREWLLLLVLLLSRFSRVRHCVIPYGSPPGSPIPGILQARTLEWVATSFSIYLSSPIYSLVILGKVFNHSEPGSSPQGCHEHQLSWCEALKIERTAHRLVVITGLHQCAPEPVCADCTPLVHPLRVHPPQLGCRLLQGVDTG